MSATINLTIAPSLTAGLDLRSGLELNGGEPIVILPSSLDRGDRAAAELHTWLRAQEVPSRLLVPTSMISATLSRRKHDWSSLNVRPDEAGDTQAARLPSSLVDAPRVCTLTNLDVVGGRGPYILDLLGRYTDASTRLRLLGSRHRAELAVALLRKRPLSQHVIVRHFPAFALLATTRDPIAAELISLALVDEDLARDQQVTGPWEDDLVQRATELDLGVRLPAEIRIAVAGARHCGIDSMLERVAARLGIRFDELAFLDPV